ncbi:DUF397 domain-containing protein [Nocardia uniformis]|uniref:DUF397 domain-containing protein n=1 Tax=Nocardia uniformis TaxID=53432 RepID=A0A849C4Y4_9NOCA|nr:DUF397 domain-containing protein [Nocardia uniformis]NNH71395.1 DUF397 domain-containing protein [Nocardia uniformis]
MNKPVKGKWYKSSRSDAGKDCVEVYHADDAVGVRDSKNPGGPELFFSGKAWNDFLTSGIWER